MYFFPSCSTYDPGCDEDRRKKRVGVAQEVGRNERHLHVGVPCIMYVSLENKSVDANYLRRSLSSRPDHRTVEAQEIASQKEQDGSHVFLNLINCARN
jgi:hypothetical protein